MLRQETGGFLVFHVCILGVREDNGGNGKCKGRKQEAFRYFMFDISYFA